MLRGSVVPFAVQYERRSRQAGLAQGLEEGRKEIRSMHIRMARARFGAQVSEGLAALLLPVSSVGLLDRRHRGRSQDRRGAACNGGRSGRV